MYGYARAGERQGKRNWDWGGQNERCRCAVAAGPAIAIAIAIAIVIVIVIVTVIVRDRLSRRDAERETQGSWLARPAERAARMDGQEARRARGWTRARDNGGFRPRGGKQTLETRACV